MDKPQNKEMNFFKRNPIIPNINISAAIELTSLFFREREAIECKSLMLSYDQLIDYYHIIGRAFKELGIKKVILFQFVWRIVFKGLLHF